MFFFVVHASMAYDYLLGVFGIAVFAVISDVLYLNLKGISF